MESKQIFAKGLKNFELREEAWRLCANYVGGVWKEVSASDIVMTVPPGVGPTVLGVFRGGRIEEYIQSRIITNKELCNIQ
ncbi:unnamed protein product [Enterobius vermicularis]|uniref:Macro domain-containing protein n=1 Tax=Enterobius vermicularis TaxID=51028 RepID=A0A0N4UU53_ENTVE|nr:unnamed protein product [Enterobius vermicularis]